MQLKLKRRWREDEDLKKRVSKGYSKAIKAKWNDPEYVENQSKIRSSKTIEYWKSKAYQKAHHIKFINDLNQFKRNILHYGLRELCEIYSMDQKTLYRIFNKHFGTNNLKKTREKIREIND